VCNDFPEYHVKILFEDFNAVLCKRGYFKADSWECKFTG
jgi:hypothetical protein